MNAATRTCLGRLGALSLALLLGACSTLDEPDPIVAQMRSGGACTPASTLASTGPEHGAAPTAAPASPPRLDLQGQMSIKLAPFQDQPAKGISLGFFFSGNAAQGQLDLMTLMGSQMAKVSWQPGEAWLTDNKGQHRYDSLDSLSAQVLGDPLPLRQLVHWMQGRPDPDLPSQAGVAPDTFTQLGWLIDASQLDHQKLNARREPQAWQRGVQLKVYLDR